MNDNKNMQLKFRVSEEELEIIRQNAKAVNKSVSAYLCDIGTNMCVIKWDYQQILEHSNKITALQNSVNQLVYTIKKTGTYVPSDLEYILNQMNEIQENEIEFLEMMRVDKAEKTNILKKEIRKIVKEKIKESKKK